MSIESADYNHGVDPERALKYAIQHIRGDRAQIVEGVIEPVSPTWDHETTAETIRDQIRARARELDCVTGSGNLDLPGSSNWYVPDIAVVPAAVAKGAGALLPSDTLLVVEVTSESNAESETPSVRGVRGAALPTGRPSRAFGNSVLGAMPTRLHTSRRPHPYGTTVRIPEPFGLDLDTNGL
ncbi:Putative restriction endonuclease [Streptomyces sp. KS_16]|nr:putative restriction endonuclease [Streptomyces sp. 2321.6]SDQ62896.1 Putative restriction endonuclease [Streptomyces sp. KS_16]SEE18050.1 Putative restriction endonuclease [Streptomyces sp. 2133.1]SNC74236.1 Putative restriction endonuclease [Streptomyces sp. 2114.4]